VAVFAKIPDYLLPKVEGSDGSAEKLTEIRAKAQTTTKNADFRGKSAPCFVVPEHKKTIGSPA
jgi:hypothetical protein